MKHQIAKLNISKIMNKNVNLSDSNIINIDYEFNDETIKILELKEKIAYLQHIYNKQIEKNKYYANKIELFEP